MFDFSEVYRVVFFKKWVKQEDKRVSHLFLFD